MKERPYIRTQERTPSLKCVAPLAGLCEIGHPGCTFSAGTTDIKDVKGRSGGCIKPCEELKYFIVVM
jgi:hypothetical protein